MESKTLNDIINFNIISGEGLMLEDFTYGNFGFEDLFGEDPEEVFYYKGNVIFDTNVYIREAKRYGMYIIDGDLTIKGSLILQILDSYNVLLVKGNLVVENLLLNSETFIIVEKDCKVSGVLVDDLSDGGGAFIHGDLDNEIGITMNSDGSTIMLNDGNFAELSAEIINKEMGFGEVCEAVLKGEKIYC